MAETLAFLSFGLLILIVVAFIGAGLWLIGIYNGLVKLRNQVKNAFSQIDVQLKRRYDLIPNLVETAKTYMSHEKETLEAVIQARNNAKKAEEAAANNPSDPKLMSQLVSAEASLGSSMGRFTMTMEAYPDLKANTTMNQLMEELSSTENKISFARQAYNDAVLFYNNKREVFPNSFIAGSFNFEPAKSFEIEKAEEREPVKVSFS